MITILYSLRIVRSDGCKCITGMGENRKSGSENPAERRAANCRLRKSLEKNFFSRKPEEIARHKLFRPISSGNRPPKTFSAHFLRKSPATNFFGSFPQEISRHKTFSAHFLRKSAATKLFRLISSGNRSPQTFSAHFLRKSLDGLPLISSGNRRMAYIELTLRKTNALSTQTTSSFSLPHHRSTKRDHTSRP